MTLKRKRADDSPFSTSSFSLSSPESQSPIPIPHTYSSDMDICHASPFSFGTSWPKVKLGHEGADWGGRTRKRWRDNRPDERAVHETTIQKLFSAQRNHPHAEPIPSLAPEPQVVKQMVVAPPVQKSTLHSFWKISAPPVQPPLFHLPQQQTVDQPRCGECEAPLRDGADGMDIDGNGGVVASPFACSECGKSVCETCAVVSDTRHCLQCATASLGRRREAWM